MKQEERHESITGPLGGYWVVAYTVATAEGFAGYAKVCARRPDSVWECRPFVKMATGCAATPQTALLLAQECGRGLAVALAREPVATLPQSWRPAGRRTSCRPLSASF